MSYDETNRGAIWKNDKEGVESRPDFTGKLDVEGKEYWVSAWKRKPDAKPKAPALSFQIQAAEQRRTEPGSQEPDNFVPDDIPF